jgi:type III secretion system FlhB-like substrate exporter
MTTRADKAVALHYSDELPAPLVVAAGRGPLAEAILRVARENGVPVVENAPVAETLLELDVNALVPETLYAVIAEILVFVRQVRNAA